MAVKVSANKCPPVAFFALIFNFLSLLAWSRFVRKQLEKWERTNLVWATEFSGQVKIVQYEDLVTNVDATLRGILKFLNRPVDEKLLNCTLSKKEGNYKRNKITKEVFDPYSDQLLQMIAKKKRKVFDTILSGR